MVGEDRSGVHGLAGSVKAGAGRDGAGVGSGLGAAAFRELIYLLTWVFTGIGRSVSRGTLGVGI